VSARSAAVLDRFPVHVAASDPGKRFGAVVAALAADLDILTRQAQDVRTAHRIREVRTDLDLYRLAAVHDLTDAATRPLGRRLAALHAAATMATLDVDLLATLLGVPATALTALGAALPAVVSGPTRHRARLAARRGVVLGAVHAHAVGNATPTALLEATAAYLGLTVERVHHSGDGWWHLATCREGIHLARPPGPVSGPPQPDLTALTDLIALEENPVRDADLAPAPKRHGQRTRILRSGMSDVDVTIRVLGTADRTVRPMVVHLASGRGVVYEGSIADGVELAFGSDGRVTLDGHEDVTHNAWGFVGAVFADGGQALPAEDFVFTANDGTVPGNAGTAGRFAVSAPITDAFGPTPSLPHGAAAVGPLRLPRGQSHWTVLVRVAHAGATPESVPAPRTVAGFFDGSVFAPAPEPCLHLGFAWTEREPFAVRVWLPGRLGTVDDEGGTVLRAPLIRLLDRHRAAGVAVSMAYADPHWSLGRGVLHSEEDGGDAVLAGTRLWPDGTPQPVPDPS
jgi:hypothetical protein